MKEKSCCQTLILANHIVDLQNVVKKINNNFCLLTLQVFCIVSYKKGFTKINATHSKKV